MRVQVAALAASIFINAAAFVTLERAVSGYGVSIDLRRQASRQEISEAGNGATQFDFVEAPPVVSLREPVKNNKIAPHDSVAQDASKAPDALRGDGPKIEKEGPADQLEQRRAENLSLPGSPASPASQPSPALQGQVSRDRIDTPAVSRTRSHGAQVYGMTSFDATGSGMGQYMKNLKERIWLAWFPYLSFHYPKDFKTADAVILFKLDREGQVRNVQVLSSEGTPIFSAFCMEAVQRASPFGPPPAEVLDLIGRDELDVQFVFHFW